MNCTEAPRGAINFTAGSVRNLGGEEVFMWYLVKTGTFIHVSLARENAPAKKSLCDVLCSYKPNTK